MLESLFLTFRSRVNPIKITTGLRYRNLDSSGVDIKLEEDTSLDSEIGHTIETVDFLALEGIGSLSGVPVELI